MSTDNKDADVVVKGNVVWNPVKLVKVGGYRHELYFYIGCKLNCQTTRRISEAEPTTCLNGDKTRPLTWKNSDGGAK
jgi:hypothetical protein